MVTTVWSGSDFNFKFKISHQKHAIKHLKITNQRPLFTYLGTQFNFGGKLVPMIHIFESFKCHHIASQFPHNLSVKVNSAFKKQERFNIRS